MTQLIYDKRRGYIVKKWPRRRGKPKNPRQLEIIDAFKRANESVRLTPAPFVVFARIMEQGIVSTWHDLLMSCCFGNLWTVKQKDGLIWRGLLMSYSAIQAYLDSITQTPGSILYRGTDDWTQLEPGDNNDLLVSQGPPNPPTYKPYTAIITGFMPTAGGTFTGDVYQVNATASVTFEQSANAGANHIMRRYSTDAQGPQQQMYKARGSIAAPLNAANGDRSFQQRGEFWGDGAFIEAARAEVRCKEPIPSSTRMGAYWRILLNALSSVSLVEVVRFDANTGLSIGGSTPTISMDGVTRLLPFSKTSLPSATAGKAIMVTDSTRGNRPCYYDGGFWRFFSDDAILT